MSRRGAWESFGISKRLSYIGFNFWMEDEQTLECWTGVIGFTLYEVSDLGRVRNIKTGRILKPKTDKDGYQVVNLARAGRIETRSIHRLVAMAFSSWTDYSLQVNHEDGIKQNNRIDNLEWTTPSGNTRHAYRIGLITPEDRIPNMIENNKNPIEIVETGERFDSITDCANKIGVDPSGISKVLKKNGVNHSTKGYTFRYVDKSR